VLSESRNLFDDNLNCVFVTIEPKCGNFYLVVIHAIFVRLVHNFDCLFIAIWGGK